MKFYVDPNKLTSISENGLVDFAEFYMVYKWDLGIDRDIKIKNVTKLDHTDSLKMQHDEAAGLQNDKIQADRESKLTAVA